MPESSEPVPGDPATMRDWLSPLLRCPRCDSRELASSRTGLTCAGCRVLFPVDDDLGDFLGDPHPAVAREIAAVASLDRHDPDKAGRLRSLLTDLDRGAIEPGDPRLAEFPSFYEFFAANRRTRRMLEALAPEPGSIAVEIGADHCLHSGALLDAGCRVVAVDITEHLRLAPRGGDPHLCRLRADMNRLPLADGVADLVWATACVHHSWSLEGTFREARRVLGPGGRFVLLSEPMPAWPRYLLFGFGTLFGREQRRLGINETLHRRPTWLAAARAAGFAARLEVPALERREIADRLARRGLPAWLAPWAERFERQLRVSIHMIAEAPLSPEAANSA